MAHTANRAAGALYSEAVLDHFQNPRNAGELSDATATVEVSNPVCGDILRLAVRVDGERIVAARFKTRGCVTAIACSSFLAEMICAKTLQEVRAITAAQIAEALGGLPPASAHGSQLAMDALEAVLRKAK
jgi:nitrogen fixation protein NifU and related proteins